MSYLDDEIDWYCDSCNAYLNTQAGFTTIGGTWVCAMCGAINDVTEGNIIFDSEDAENIFDNGSDDEADESLSVYDAALIWASNGMDEDYTFGYTEDELRNAM